VGIAALSATFWLLVVTLRLILAGGGERAAPTTALVVAPPAAEVPAPALPAVDKTARRVGFICGLPHHRERTPAPLPVGNALSKAAVVVGFNALRPQIAECFARYQVPGLAMANVVIAKSGKVSKAAVTGKFAGTPTGACVEAAVKTARFPASDGFVTPYPFQLR
jgi:hypothetical protein